MQVVLLCLQQFRCNSLLMCDPLFQHKNAKKINKIVYFEDSRSFKVINVDTHKKLTKSLLQQAASLSVCNAVHAK